MASRKASARVTQVVAAPTAALAAPKRNGNGGGGKPSWMKEISGANSDRRPVRMGE